VILRDSGFKAKPGAPYPSGRSSSTCSHPSWGVVERKAKRGRALGRLVPQEGMEMDRWCLVRLGNGGGMMTTENDRNCKRSAVMQGMHGRRRKWELLGS
jgi:hypothetical protein